MTKGKNVFKKPAYNLKSSPLANLATYFYGGHHYHHAMNPLTRVVKQKLV